MGSGLGKTGTGEGGRVGLGTEDSRGGERALELGGAGMRGGVKVERRRCPSRFGQELWKQQVGGSQGRLGGAVGPRGKGSVVGVGKVNLRFLKG